MMDRQPSRCGRDEGARSDNDPRIAGFIRTCAKDVDFLVFALRSICKFAFPLLSSVTVVFPEYERSQLEPLLRGAFPWVTVRPTDTEVRIAAQFLNMTGRRADINRAGHSFMVPGVGYHAAMIDKLNADVLIGSAYDYVMFCDYSDNLFTRTLRMSDLFVGDMAVRPRRAPVLRMLAYKYVPGSQHEQAWRSVTARLLNLTVDETAHSFMTHVGGLTFPLWIYEPLRAHLHRVLLGSTGETDLYQYAARLMSPTHRGQKHFIDFELMGGAMYYVWGEGNQSHYTVEPHEPAADHLRELVSHGVAFELADSTEVTSHRRRRFPALQITSWHGPPPLRVRIVYECILGASSREAEEFDFTQCQNNLHGSHYTGSSEAIKCACERNRTSVSGAQKVHG